MENIFLYPPIIFAVAFIGIWLFSKLTSNFSPRKPSKPKGKFDAYACGEDYTEKKIEPDYKMFFPFAIFFTVLHVAGLMIATLAAASTAWVTTGLACLYICSVGVILVVLYAD
ncbi:NADH-quinone oxidoreductase subunit A [Elusimicrobium posterum]|uniref:NADH-quinone oxidoreductase subunit A n=1 Tax=Elusimicrobium posterum TaxID=3116653 RepID=UPI003C7590FA